MDHALREHARKTRLLVRDGGLRGDAFRDALLSVPFVDRDVWFDAVLELDDVPDDIATLPRGAVPYVPCGVDAVLRAVLDAPVTERDVFIDLGAGVGRVLALVHLLSGARCRGVELQAPLVELGRACVRDLGLGGVELVVGDAAAAELSDGDVFFIYASFSQPVLRAVLRNLERVARTKPIVLCAVGFDVVGEPWLTARASESPELTLYDSRRNGG